MIVFCGGPYFSNPQIVCWSSPKVLYLKIGGKTNQTLHPGTVGKPSLSAFQRCPDEVSGSSCTPSYGRLKLKAGQEGQNILVPSSH